MQRRVAPLYVLTLALLASLATEAPAQAVLGPGDDALVLPRGALRVRFVNAWTHANERYGAGTPNRTGLEPIGIDFNLDTIGVVVFPNLTPLQAGLRTLTGMPDWTLSLGRTVVNSDIEVTTTPIVVELGVTKNFSAGLMVPYVRTRNNIFFAANPAGREGNAGFNPAFASGAVGTAARTQNQNLVNQLRAAATAVETSLGGPPFCAANPTDARCALIANTRAFAGGIEQIYGTTTAGATGSPFVPIVGTDAQLAIEARIAGLKGLLGAAGAGITVTGPFAAQNRLGVADAQRILTDPLFGIEGAPLETVEHSHIGDIEIGGKYRFFDTFERRGTDRLKPRGINYRSSVGLNLRLPTGETDMPNNFDDVGTGNGQTDIEARWFTDFLVGRYFWTSFIARYNWQLADDQFMRIFDVPERPLTAAYRQHRVHRDLGDQFELELNPRIVVTDWFGLMGHYQYRHKFEDRYTGSFDIPAAVTGYADITLPASNLNQQTEQWEHRLGGGFSLSTVARFAEGKSKIPLELNFFHFQTTRGFGGNTYKLFSDQVQLRLYTRIFGGSETAK